MCFEGGEQISRRNCNNKCSAVCCTGCNDIPLSFSKLGLTPLYRADNLWENEKLKADTSDIGVDVSWRGERDLRKDINR